MWYFKRMSLHRFGALHYLKLNPAFSYSPINFSRSFLCLFSTVFSSPTQPSPERVPIIDYLSINFKLSKSQSVSISKQLSKTRCPQHPWTVLNYFKQIGLSESQIRSMITLKPQILFSHVDKTLKPKIEYLELLGFQGSKLGEFLSKNAVLLMCNLNKTVVPSVEFVKKLVNNEEYFIKVLQRYGNYIIPNQQKVLRSAAFFESCGIVGSQLSFLLMHHACLFLTQESLLRDYVSRAVNMGFSMNSGMFVYVLRTISGMSIAKFNRKLELIQSCGFSKHETMQMFRRAPVLFSKSEKGLKFGIQVFLHTIMVPKSLLVSNPVILTLSMEKRVIPRWREKKFLEKYVSKFSDDVEALLEAYKGPHLEDASK